MRAAQNRAFWQQQITLHPYAVARMIAFQALEAVDERRKAVAEEGHLLLERIRHRGARKADYVGESGGAPIADDKYRQQCGAGRIKPPRASGLPDYGEKEGQCVEDDIRFTVCQSVWRSGRKAKRTLSQRLDLRRFDWNATKPDYALDDDRCDHGADGCSAE